MNPVRKIPSSDCWISDNFNLLFWVAAILIGFTSWWFPPVIGSTRILSFLVSQSESIDLLKDFGAYSLLWRTVRLLNVVGSILLFLLLAILVKLNFRPNAASSRIAEIFLVALWIVNPWQGTIFEVSRLIGLSGLVIALLLSYARVPAFLSRTIVFTAILLSAANSFVNPMERWSLLPGLTAIESHINSEGTPVDLYVAGEFAGLGFDTDALRSQVALKLKVRVKEVVGIDDFVPLPNRRSFFVRAYTPEEGQIKVHRQYRSRCRLVSSNEFLFFDLNRLNPPYFGLRSPHQVVEVFECAQGDFLAKLQ